MGHVETGCPYLAPPFYPPPQGPLRQSRDPDRENCPSLTKLAPFILLLFAISSSGYKNSLRSRSYVEIARAAPRATSMQLVIRYPALASSIHFGLALRPLKAACIFAGSNSGNT